VEVLILIPAYNEAPVVGRVVAEARRVMGEGQTILVIDDGSSDGTAAAAEEAGAVTISLIRNLGYGYALQTGYRYALDHGYSTVVQLDGDGQHDPTSIPRLIDPISRGEADVVIGSRRLSAVPYTMPFLRRLGQAVFATLLRWMCGLRIGDPTSGFQAIGPGALALFSTDAFPGDYPDTDVLLYLSLNGKRVIEAPATFRPNTRGKSMHRGLGKAAYYAYKMMLSMVLVYLRHPGASKEPSDGRPVSARVEPANPPPEDRGPGSRDHRSGVDLPSRARSES
jgi:glycosyltransferase involved in cell wall biosynthesis